MKERANERKEYHAKHENGREAKRNTITTDEKNVSLSNNLITKVCLQTFSDIFFSLFDID